MTVALAYDNLINIYHQVEQNQIQVKDLIFLPSSVVDQEEQKKFALAMQIVPVFLEAMEKYYEAFNPQGFEKFNHERNKLAQVLEDWDEEWDKPQIDSWVSPYNVIKFGGKVPGLFNNWIMLAAKKVDKTFNTFNHSLKKKSCEQASRLNCQQLMNKVVEFWQAEIKLHNL